MNLSSLMPIIFSHTPPCSSKSRPTVGWVFGKASTDHASDLDPHHSPGLVDHATTRLIVVWGAYPRYLIQTEGRLAVARRLSDDANELRCRLGHLILLNQHGVLAAGALEGHSYLCSSSILQHVATPIDDPCFIKGNPLFPH